MKKIVFSSLLLLIVTTMNFSQTDKSKYRVFDSNGSPKKLENIIQKISEVDVVFLGETHDDSVGHSLQFDIFKGIYEKYGKDRKIALSLEMFERDVQIIIDEYLQELIPEKVFLANARPWGNYKTDYRPLVEVARENKLKVIAANAPRRYVNMVSRLGRDSLNNLSPEAKKWLPPLPFPKSSKKYSDKFNARMMGHGSENILQSQTLWDATMAYSVSEYLKKNKSNLVVHLNGSFHTENRLGTVEQLLKYKPDTRVLVVTMLYEDNFKNFDKKKHTNLGDFVILTDPTQPRSKR